MENKENNYNQELIEFYNCQLKVFEGARKTRDTRTEGHRILNAMRSYMENLYGAIEGATPGLVINPGRAIIEDLREYYPVGCRIVLDRMDDPQAPPIGTTGTVQGVDDIGSIMVSWDAGGSLSVAYGKDKCHRLYAVKRTDNLPIPPANLYHAGDRIMLDKDTTGIVPSGTVGSVRYVACNGEVAVRWDGYGENALIPGKDLFHRVFDTVTNPVVLANEIHRFCEETHYRQSPTIIGYWQPGAILHMIVDQLWSFSGINKIIRGLYRFRTTANLSQQDQCRADKILHDLYIRYAERSPLVTLAKNEINKFFFNAYKDPDGADYTDLCAIDVANTTHEDGREVQSVVDLVTYQIRTYVDGTLAETIQHDTLIDLILYDLRMMDYDTLVAIPDGEEAT